MSQNQLQTFNQLKVMVRMMQEAHIVKILLE